MKDLLLYGERPIMEIYLGKVRIFPSHNVATGFVDVSRGYWIDKNNKFHLIDADPMKEEFKTILEKNPYPYAVELQLPHWYSGLGSKCFEGHTSLTSIIIPEGVLLLAWACFSRCTSLSSITIPNSVTSIAPSCFEYCRSLTSIHIPSSVTSMGNECFRYCSSLKTIYVDSESEKDRVKNMVDGAYNYLPGLEYMVR